MKKITLLLLSVTLLLTACQPAATSQATEAPVEALASSINDLVGVWWYSQGGFMVEFKLDGTYQVDAGSKNVGRLDEGKFTFDSGRITIIGCNDQPATYEAYVVTQNGKPSLLRLQVVGNYACSVRAYVLKGTAKFYTP